MAAAGAVLVGKGKRSLGWVMVLSPVITALILFPVMVWALYAPVME